MSLSSKPDGQGQYAPILDINEKILVFSRKKYTNRDGTRPPANNKNLVMGQKPRSFFVDWTKTRVKKVCDCATTEKDDKQSSTNFHPNCAVHVKQYRKCHVEISSYGHNIFTWRGPSWWNRKDYIEIGFPSEVSSHFGVAYVMTSNTTAFRILHFVFECQPGVWQIFRCPSEKWEKPLVHNKWRALLNLFWGEKRWKNAFYKQETTRTDFFSRRARLGCTPPSSFQKLRCCCCCWWR